MQIQNREHSFEEIVADKEALDIDKLFYLLISFDALISYNLFVFPLLITAVSVSYASWG